MVIKRVTSVISLAVLLGASPAWAQDGESARRTDAEAYARQFNVSVVEALRRLEVQDQVGRMNEKLASERGTEFAGIWIEHTPVFRVVARTTGDSSASPLAGEVTRLGALADVRPANASLSELMVMRRLGIYLARQLEVRADANIDVRANRAELRVVDRGAFLEELATRGLVLPAGLEVVEVDALVRPEATIFGGLPITTCTLGFSVRNGSGTRGVTTAAHCGNSQSWSGGSLTFRGEAYRDSFDVQWHTSPGDTVTNQFDSGTGIRNCTGTRSRSAQSVGDFVCKNGRTTGYTCGTIQSTRFAPSYVPSVDATFVFVDGGSTNLSSGGDSGGPWFNGSTAFGIHSGGAGNDSVYMPINYVSGIGVSVLTN